MTPWHTERLRIAHATAAVLAAEHPGAQIRLEGALAHGLAHARSDIDLRIVTPVGQPLRVVSQVVDGIRVDLHTSTAAELGELYGLLASFDLPREGDVAAFRTVRSRLSDLTTLRTAVVLDQGEQNPVLDKNEADQYARWALADRVQAAISLTEDLLGLIEARQRLSEQLVWQRLAVVVAQAEAAAAGQPLLGEKWLPALLGLATGPDQAPRAVPTLPDTGRPFGTETAFRAVRTRLCQALTSRWGTPEPGDPSLDPAWSGLGWLPQRCSDGWALQRGDDLIPLTDVQFHAWATTTRS
ncbi:hypothetical protein ACIQOW_18695 [Kitasatospora sp. NPDC091335]|uniref:hypothetical protein n=1 Tax=Kitasatospora sp. NPDC091335 TaxID=3364085 RepID=UPI00380A8F02